MRKIKYTFFYKKVIDLKHISFNKLPEIFLTVTL